MAGLRKILLVEDNPQLRGIYTLFLQQNGFDVATAGDGEEALQVATDYKPDLVFFRCYDPQKRWIRGTKTPQTPTAI